MTDTAALAALKVEVQHLAQAVSDLTDKVEELTAQANRWKGAFGVVLVLGGALSWFGQMLFERVWK